MPSVTTRTNEPLARLARPAGLVQPPRAKGNNHRRFRPPVAFLSPLPPRDSGVADYAVRLLPELDRHFRVDLFAEPGFEPLMGALALSHSSFDLRLYNRLARLHAYQGTLIQLGNSHYHGFAYDHLLAHGGIVTLHDLYLPGFHWWRANQQARSACAPSTIRQYFTDLIDPDKRDDLSPWVEEWCHQPEELKRQLVKHDQPLIGPIVRAAEAVIVHSRWALDRLQRRYPSLAHRFHHVPMGSVPVGVDLRNRDLLRKRLGFTPQDLLVGSFGIVHHQKMNSEAVQAFASLLQQVPEATFLFAGPLADEGEAQQLSERLGLGDRVRFLGRVSDSAFFELLSCVDIAINLRRPPTNGESSIALLHLLGHGIPTVITDVDAFTDFPSSVARKIPGGPAAVDALARALLELASSPEQRRGLGRQARECVRAQHTWARVADRYAQVIHQVSHATH